MVTAKNLKPEQLSVKQLRSELKRKGKPMPSWAKKATLVKNRKHLAKDLQHEDSGSES